MKIRAAIAGAGILSILTGAYVKDISKRLALLLIVVGIALLLSVFLSACIKHADRCPRCGVILHRGIRVYREQRDGMIHCPRCSSLVKVAERK